MSASAILLVAGGSEVARHIALSFALAPASAVPTSAAPVVRSADDLAGLARDLRSDAWR